MYRRKKRDHHFYSFSFRKMNNSENSEKEIPSTLTYISAEVHGVSGGELFLNHIPVAKSSWTYDERDRIICWRGVFGGGKLHIAHDASGAYGIIGDNLDFVSVQASYTANFSCDVALNTGAVFTTTSGGKISGMTWEAESSQWLSAAWIKNRLFLSYTEASGGPMQPPVFTFSFSDLETCSMPWTPESFIGSVIAGEGWDLNFQSNIAPDPDSGPNPPEGPVTVYPYWLMAVEDNAAAIIKGAMDISSPGNFSDTLVGISGVRANPLIAGYFHIHPKKVPFGIFNGKLLIAESWVAKSFVANNELHWDGLNDREQEITGLPKKGKIKFTERGQPARVKTTLRVVRLNTEATIESLNFHNSYYPKAAVVTTRFADPQPLSILDLEAMNPYTQNIQGQWYDQVQQAVTSDLQTIMNSFISPDIYNLLFPTQVQPTLSGELAIVANSPVKGVTDPTAWYKNLGTAVMSQGLAGGNDKYCKNLNGPRAGQWLQTEVAASQVYYQHGQLLFQYEWNNLFTQTQQFLNDQIVNAPAYNSTIDSRTAAQVLDINTNVCPDPTDPDLIPTLIKQVQDCGQYAKDNNVYWAFYYFTYNTAPAVLANIAMQMYMGTGNADGSALSRMFQQNAAVLTALDPQGYLATQYTQTLNVFLTTNVLPNMFGFTGDPATYSIIKEYLETFVTENLNNENKQIAQAAQDLQELITSGELPQVLQGSIDIINQLGAIIQQTFALPAIANEWLPAFQKAFPKWAKLGSAFGSILFTGMAGLAAYEMVTTFEGWDKLNADQRAQLISNTIQLGLQVLAAVVQRGVRLYAIFTAEGLTGLQRAGAVAKILATGEAGALDEALVKIGNATARWLGDTVGSAAPLQDAEVTEIMMIGDADVEVASEVSLAIRVLGNNLDEFIASRLAPVCILAGIAFSIYNLIEGESKISVAIDALNIAAGCLTLVALAGTWAVAGGTLATICAFAGPLAILAALAGVALLIYEMFQKPPDPVQEFVNNYANPAGFGITAAASAMDYVTPYMNIMPNGNLMMLGFNLSSGLLTFRCLTDGVISLGAPDSLPDSVWFSLTDGLGISGIYARQNYQGSTSPIQLSLSLLSDNTVMFLPQTAPGDMVTIPGSNATLVTQKWLCAPLGDGTLAIDGQNLASLNFTIQPVPPDTKGNYAAAAASGWLNVSATNIVFSATQGANFTLNMSGIAPNGFSMKTMSFIQNTKPSPQNCFGPSFATQASYDLTFVLSGDPLPSFLEFDPATAKFTPNGTNVDAIQTCNCALKVSNLLSSESVNFQVICSAPTKTLIYE